MSNDSRPSLTAGVIFWNDKKGLERLLPTLKDFDRVYCIDGRFKAMAGNCNSSDDGSWELVLKYNYQYPNGYNNALEPEKRNTYLSMAEKYNDDYLLVIDSDEWISGDIQTFKHNLGTVMLLESPDDEGVYSVDYVNQDNKADIKPRIFRKPGNLRYWEAHNMLQKIDTKRIFRPSVECPLIKGIVMHHDHKLRTIEREQQIQEYQKWLFAYEAPFKKREEYLQGIRKV